MEARFAEEKSYHSDHRPVSQSKSSPLELRPTQLAVVHDEQEEEICDHFSIRGYVAEICKRDAKICWPFFMFRDYDSDEHARLLPPVCVTKYRRWDCQDCLRKVNAREETVQTGSFAKVQNAEVKRGTTLTENTIMASHADDRKSCLHELFQKMIAKGKFVEADSSVQCFPLMCCSRNETNCVAVTPNTIGLEVPRASHDSSYEGIQNQPSEKPADIVTDDEACKMGKSGKENRLLTVQAFKPSNPEDTMNPKPTGTELRHEVADFRKVADLTNSVIVVSGQTDDQLRNEVGEMKGQCDDASQEAAMPLEEVIGVREVDSQTAVAISVSNPDLKGLEDRDLETSKYNLGLPVQRHNDGSQSVNSAGKLCYKRARKVRLLNDVMRSEKSEISGKVHFSAGDAEASRVKNNHQRKTQGSKRKNRSLDRKLHPTSLGSKVKPVKSKKRHKSIDIEDDGSSLMYWLNKVGKSVISNKKRAKGKLTNSAIVSSKLAADTSAGRDQDLISKCCEVKKYKQKAIASEMQTVIPQALTAQQGDMTRGNGSDVAKYEATGPVHSETIHFKSTGITYPDKRQHCGPEVQSRNHKKTVLNTKKKVIQVQNEALQVQNQDYSHMYLSKGQKRVAKKQRTRQICEQESLDDIPMDIVELLAKNQHERRIMDAKDVTDNMHDVLKMVEDVDDSNNLDVNQPHGNNVADAVYKGPSQESFWDNSGDCVWTTVRSDRTDGKLKADHILKQGKQKHQIISATTGFQAPLECEGQTMSSAHKSLVYPRKKCFLQYHNWNRMEVQTMESFSSQNSIPNVCAESLGLLNGTSFGITTQKAGAGFSDMNIFHHPNTVALETNNVVAVNQTCKYLLNRNKSAELSVLERTFPTATSLSEAGNTCHPNITRPIDLYTNETISAMNLLRLMDSAKWSGSSLHESTDANRIGCIEESDYYSTNGCKKTVTSEGRLKTSQPMQHSVITGHCHQDQHQDLCKPFQQHPRIGVLGSLLQQEIGSRANNCGTTSVINIAHFSDQTPFRANGKENCRSPSSATHTTLLNAPNPISRDENSKPPSSIVNSIAYPGCPDEKDKIIQVGIGNKEEAVQPLKHGGKMEICVINRNPADFNILDEDNEYMRESDNNIWPSYTAPSGIREYTIHPSGQRRQKVIKLTDML